MKGEDAIFRRENRGPRRAQDVAWIAISAASRGKGEAGT